MKLFSLQLVTVVFIIIFFNACKDKEQADLNTDNNNHKTNIKYAKGFEIQQFKDFKKLLIKAPYQNSKETFEFILTKKNTKTPPKLTMTMGATTTKKKRGTRK